MVSLAPRSRASLRASAAAGMVSPLSLRVLATWTWTHFVRRLVVAVSTTRAREQQVRSVVSFGALPGLTPPPPPVRGVVVWCDVFSFFLSLLEPQSIIIHTPPAAFFFTTRASGSHAPLLGPVCHVGRRRRRRPEGTSDVHLDGAKSQAQLSPSHGTGRVKGEGGKGNRMRCTSHIDPWAGGWSNSRGRYRVSWVSGLA